MELIPAIDPHVLVLLVFLDPLGGHRGWVEREAVVLNSEPADITEHLSACLQGRLAPGQPVQESEGSEGTEGEGTVSVSAIL